MIFYNIICRNPLRHYCDANGGRKPSVDELKKMLSAPVFHPNLKMRFSSLTVIFEESQINEEKRPTASQEYQTYPLVNYNGQFPRLYDSDVQLCNFNFAYTVIMTL